MIDMLQTVIPKSEQLNADDLIGRTLTIKVTKVSLAAEPEQPVSISFEGDNGKPYKACKSMRRVLIRCWGNDGTAYAGRSMTLYRDDKVRFGGLAVGGIRISHMSHIDKPVTMALTESKARRQPFTVQPLAVSTAPALDPDLSNLAEHAAAGGTLTYQTFFGGLTKLQKTALLPEHERLKGVAAKASSLPPAETVEDVDETEEI